MDEEGCVALYGLCVVCGAARKAYYNLDGDTLTVMMGCLADRTHELDLRQ